MPTDYTRDVQQPLSGQEEPQNTADALSQQLADTTAKVAEKIKDSSSILVALSKDPSVDEIAAALGLTLMLSRIGKHVTSIYSGLTPNTLQFLQPDKTFETNTNSLQDFIIAINKDKADHLRYKIEGDYVKVYITPYRTFISEKDLEFDRGDYNVDLVIAIDVNSGEAIDGALSEYGRIMHDATAINITTNVPGHFAEIEWSDPAASSVCELIMELANELHFDDFTEDIATALLTGIVAATNRFSNERTQPNTMTIASKLMAAGADQQLISNNIMKPTTTFASNPDVSAFASAEQQQTDESSIKIQREQEPPAPTYAEELPPEPTPISEVPNLEQPIEQSVAMMPAPEAPVTAPVPSPAAPIPAPLVSAPVQAPVATPEPVFQAPVAPVQAAPVTPTAVPAPYPEPTPAAGATVENGELTALSEAGPSSVDYATLMQEALREPEPQVNPMFVNLSQDQNPAQMIAPAVNTLADNSVPEIQYLASAPTEPTPPAPTYPTPDMFPPAPAPNVDTTTLPPAEPTTPEPAVAAVPVSVTPSAYPQQPTAPAPTMPEPQPAPALTYPQPVATPQQASATVPQQPLDPSAFHIPGA